MERMFVFHHSKELAEEHGPKTAYFAYDDRQYDELKKLRDQALGLGKYMDEDRTATLVEKFVRKGDLGEPGEGQSDYIRTGVWKAEKKRVV